MEETSQQWNKVYGSWLDSGSKKKKRLIKDSVYMIGDIFGIRVLY